MKPKIVYNGLAGLKHFTQARMNECVHAIENKISNSEFYKGKFAGYKDVIDLIEAFEKANAENEGIE
jgi:hypothetical protein